MLRTCNCCELHMNAGSAIAIEVSDLHVVRTRGPDRHIVLDSVSFAVPRGAVAVIAGPNGVGKSTLFEVITAGLEPKRGRIMVVGKYPSEARLGVVWQSTGPSLFPWLSALDNIALPLRFRGVSRAARHRRVHQLCDEFGMRVPLDQPTYRLSGGEQQKVCVLRALASEPEVLLLDEPLASLSYEATLELLGHLQRIRVTADLTILLISHSPDHCVFMADVIIPFRSSPVRVAPDEAILVRCPHAPPRPLEWMHDRSFRDQVRDVRGEIAEPCDLEFAGKR